MTSKIASWSQVKLRNVLTYIDQLVHLDDEAEYTTITVKRRHGGLEAREKLFGSQIRTKKQFKLIPGAFIISRVQCWHQAYAIVPETIEPNMIASTNYDQFIISPEVDKRFFWWLSYSPIFTEIVRSCAFGVVIEKMVFNRDAWLDKTISIPPLPEQRRIVARIEELATRIEEARVLCEEIKADIHKVLLYEYSEIVKDAKEIPMAEVAPLIRRSVRVDPSEKYYELGIRSFGKGTFHKPPATGASLGTKRIFRIEVADLLFNIVFAWEGAVAVAKQEDHGRVGSHRFLTCVPKDSVATSSFLRFHFLTERGLEQLGEASPGSAGRNRTLGIRALEEIKVPIPPIEKQNWFDILQAKLDSTSQLQSETSVELDALLPSILDKAFKGEL